MWGMRNENYVHLHKTIQMDSISEENGMWWIEIVIKELPFFI